MFSNSLDPAPVTQQPQCLKAYELSTPLGPMIAIADESALYLLEYIEQRGMEREIERLKHQTRAVIVSGLTAPLRSIQTELSAYFDGHLSEFKTPLFLLGSDFQKTVWSALHRIPIGETRSYAALAAAIGKPTACRAVANANAANRISIVIPCHRVITSSGAPGGYAGGTTRKEWLIQHEKRLMQRK